MVMTLPRTPPTGISFAAFPPMLRPRIRGTEEGREGGGRLLLLLLLLLLSLLSLLMLPLAVRHAPSTALDVTSQSPRPRKRREGESEIGEGGRERGEGWREGGREGRNFKRIIDMTIAKRERGIENDDIVM